MTRAQRYAEMRARGMTFQRIGGMEGISAVRVFQIIRRERDRAERHFCGLKLSTRSMNVLEHHDPPLTSIDEIREAFRHKRVGQTPGAGRAVIAEIRGAVGL